jgi:WD40 repeat protein
MRAWRRHSADPRRACLRAAPLSLSLPACLPAANPAGAALLLSGAADGAVRIWAWRGQQHSPPWQCLGELQGHQSPVTCLALHSMPQQQLLLASTSADAVVRLWLLQGSHAAQQQQQPAHAAAAAAAAAAEALQRQFGAGAWQQQAPVAVGTRMQHCVALAALPGDPACVLMATGGTDSIIRLFVSAGSSGSSHDGANGQCAAAASGQEQAQQQQLLPPFELQCQLRGHDNWIKGLALTCVCEDGPGPAGSTACQQQQQQQGSGRLSLLLASAGQDRYGRIWCISTHGTRGSAADAGSTGSDDDALKSLITRWVEVHADGSPWTDACLHADPLRLLVAELHARVVPKHAFHTHTHTHTYAVDHAGMRRGPTCRPTVKRTGSHLTRSSLVTRTGSTA